MNFSKLVDDYIMKSLIGQPIDETVHCSELYNDYYTRYTITSGIAGCTNYVNNNINKLSKHFAVLASFHDHGIVLNIH